MVGDNDNDNDNYVPDDNDNDRHINWQNVQCCNLKFVWNKQKTTATPQESGWVQQTPGTEHRAPSTKNCELRIANAEWGEEEKGRKNEKVSRFYTDAQPNTYCQVAVDNM